jgi:hypothetical protein
MSDTRKLSSEIGEVHNLTAYNNYLYAKEHGYDFKYLIPALKDGEQGPLVCRNPVTKGLRHAAWAKILSIYKELKNYDTVVYLDSDAYFNNKKNLYDAINYQKEQAPIKFLLDTPWFRKANTGFIVVDNTKQAFRFLLKWFLAREVDPKYDTEGVWEQHYVQNTEDSAFTVLDINQMKLHLTVEDAIHGRLIINHVSAKVSPNQYQIIYEDIDRLNGFNWFKEVMVYLNTLCEEYDTASVVDSMYDAVTQLGEYCNHKVLAGPFKGLHISPSSHWWGGDILAKWLGTYEEPIHFAIASELQKKHDLFINIGCGDGYYGAGVGLNNPESHIALFDIAEACEVLVKDICLKNEVHNFSYSRDSSPQRISDYLDKAENPWMLVDIEGAEVDLLHLSDLPQLNKTTLIVEMHDFNRTGATEALIERFKPTHYIVNVVDTLTRDLRSMPVWLELDPHTCTQVVTEKRPVRMNWLYMLPRL